MYPIDQVLDAIWSVIEPLAAVGGSILFFAAGCAVWVWIHSVIDGGMGKKG